MKKIIFCSSLFVSALSFAEGPCPIDRVFIGPEFQHRRWTFPESTVAVNQNLWGGVVGYDRIAPWDVYVHTLGRYAAGKAWSGIWVDHNVSLELDLGYGVGFGPNCCLFVAPYIGGGYLQDHEDNYNQSYQVVIERYAYVPVGLFFQWDINCIWSIGARGQANIMFWRRLQAPFTTNMHKKTNWVVELPITLHMDEHWDLSLVGEYALEPNTQFALLSNWGRINTYGARLELGANF